MPSGQGPVGRPTGCWSLLCGVGGREGWQEACPGLRSVPPLPPPSSKRPGLPFSLLLPACLVTH